MVVRQFLQWVRAGSTADFCAVGGRERDHHGPRSRVEACAHRVDKVSLWASLLALCLCAAGCASVAPVGPMGEVEQRTITVGSIGEAERRTRIEAAAALPRLQAGEKIKVTVYGEAS